MFKKVRLFICGNFAGVFAQYDEIRIKNYGVRFSNQFADHTEIGALNNYPIMLPYIICGKNVVVVLRFKKLHIFVFVKCFICFLFPFCMYEVVKNVQMYM